MVIFVVHRVEARSLNTQLGLAIHLSQVVLENRLRYIDRCKYVGNQTDRQRNRKALDRPGPENEQEEGGNHGSYVGIDNGQKRLIEASLDSRRRRLSVTQLFADAFEHQN